MKKVLKQASETTQATSDATFAGLQADFHNTKAALEAAKNAKKEAKKAYQEALDKGEKNALHLRELITAFEQAKYMRLYHRAALDLARFRLQLWMDENNQAIPAKKALKKNGGRAENEETSA